MQSSMIDIRDFGAVDDGVTDSSAAIQAALDRAGECGGCVYVPTGTFLCHDLTMRHHTSLYGHASWSFRRFGGSILKLNDAKARCILDITGAFGVSITGLSLDGGQLGDDVHGILLDKEVPNLEEEDSPRIDTCRVGHFSGDAVHLEKAWCFSIRHSMLCHSRHGLYLKGWDGFILDNWFSGNRGWGIYACDGPHNAAVTCTGNRVEWNHAGGFAMRNAVHWNITGNYFDRSGGPSVAILEANNPDNPHNYNLTVTGNIFNRSGAGFGQELEEKYLCHMLVEDTYNLTCMGNTMLIGVDDFGGGNLSPLYGYVLDRLARSEIRSTVGDRGCVKQPVWDKGGHGQGFVLESGNITVTDSRKKTDW